MNINEQESNVIRRHTHHTSGGSSPPPDQNFLNFLKSGTFVCWRPLRRGILDPSLAAPPSIRQWSALLRDRCSNDNRHTWTTLTCKLFTPSVRLQGLERLPSECVTEQCTELHTIRPLRQIFYSLIDLLKPC